MEMPPLKKMTVEELLETHPNYSDMVEECNFLFSVYSGIKEIIKNGYISRHEREPISSYKRRIENLFSLDYSESIVEIFNFYLFKDQGTKVLGRLHNNELWSLFFNNADLYGNSFEEVLKEIDLYATVLGHMGLIIDKPNFETKTRNDQIKNKIYPYIVKYFPQNILDWKFEKDQFGKPVLSYLKLKEDNIFKIWRIDRWELWELPQGLNQISLQVYNRKERKATRKKLTIGKSNEAILIDSRRNPLNKIPFIWFYNKRSTIQGIGKSDINSIARIDLSIINNFSQIEQIINFASFPMMRKPKREIKPTEVNSPLQDDEVGVESILEFDPENPQSKPDWLPAEVRNPIDAILEVIEKKIAEIYRSKNIGGLAATEPTANPTSGVAKKIDFQMLNSKILDKSINLEKVEKRIIEIWLEWENLSDYMEEIAINRPKTFDIQNLELDLKNALSSKVFVMSETFNKIMQKRIARMSLTNATEGELMVIDQEIEKSTFDNTEEKENNFDMEDEDEKEKEEEEEE